MVKAHPDQFPKKLDQIPLPSVDEIEKDPKLAGFTLSTAAVPTLPRCDQGPGEAG
jgi:hypothetical protein